jgi:hypothetical protein
MFKPRNADRINGRDRSAGYDAGFRLERFTVYLQNELLRPL